MPLLHHQRGESQPIFGKQLSRRVAEMLRKKHEGWVKKDFEEICRKQLKRLVAGKRFSHYLNPADSGCFEVKLGLDSVTI